MMTMAMMGRACNMILDSQESFPLVRDAIRSGLAGDVPAREQVAGNACEPDARRPCERPGTGFPAPGFPPPLPARVPEQWLCGVEGPLGGCARYGGASAAAFHRTSLLDALSQKCDWEPWTGVL